MVLQSACERFPFQCTRVTIQVRGIGCSRCSGQPLSHSCMSSVTMRQGGFPCNPWECVLASHHVSMLCYGTCRCISASTDAYDLMISESMMARAPDSMEAVRPKTALRQFTRLTFQCSEAGAAAEALQGGGSVPLTYDVVAVQPANERVFQQVNP